MVAALGDGRSASSALRALTALSASGHDAVAKNALPKVQEFICRWGRGGIKMDWDEFFFFLLLLLLLLLLHFLLEIFAASIAGRLLLPRWNN